MLLYGWITDPRGNLVLVEVGSFIQQRLFVLDMHQNVVGWAIDLKPDGDHHFDRMIGFGA